MAKVRRKAVGGSSDLVEESGEKDPASLPVAVPTDQNWKLYTHGVTQSILSRLMTCPMKAHLSTRERLSQIRTGGALSFGSLVHECLEHVYKSFQTNRSIDAPTDGEGIVRIHPLTVINDTLSVFLETVEERDMEVLHKTGMATPSMLTDLETNFGMAEIVLKAYFKRWTRDYEHYNWLSLEEQFCTAYPCPDGKDIPVRGKFDGVLRIKEKLWLFETKTKARIEDDNITSKMNFEIQVMLYLWAIRRIYGETPMGVIYNVIRRPQLKQTQKESLAQFLQRVESDIAERPDFYFVRYEAAILESEMSSWSLDFAEMMRQLQQWSDGAFNYRNSSACTGMYGACEYLRYCSSGSKDGLRVREQLFPELTERE